MRNQFAVLGILVCTWWGVYVGCAQHPETDHQNTAYATYTNIPGVTEEEIDAIKNLKKKHGGFVIAMNHSTEAFYRQDGTIGGYTSLFCTWLSDLFGISFTPVIVEWDALIEGLGSHAIDFTGELTATPERLKIYQMTDTIAERTIKLFRLTGSEKLSVLAAERELRYAFLEGATSGNYVREAADEAFTATYVKDYDEAVTLLREGRIDAFFEDGTAEAAFDVYGDITVTQYLPLIYTPVSLSTGNPELAPIIRVVQRYLKQGAIYHLTQLYNQGEQEYRKHKLFSQLSEAEKNYLRIHAEKGVPIPIAAEYDNYPSSFYNTTEQRWQGIAHDVLQDISTLTGLSFKIVNTPDTVWPELLDALTTGKVALITELIPSKDRQGQYLWPEDPYCTDNFALVSRGEQDNIRVNQILYSSVAVAKGTAYEEIFDKWFPNHPRTVRYNSTDKCFLALEKKDVDFVMASRNLTLSLTNYAEKPGFKVNILFANTYSSSFGLNKNETVLGAVISKVQKLVDTDRISDQWIHKVFDYRAKLIRARIPYLIGLAILLTLVLALLVLLLRHNKKSGRELERLVKQRTRELEVQTQAAQAASRAKSEFLSRMSHEIRTPLNAIIGMAQIGRQIPGLPQKSIETSNEIITASNHLLEVLNDILDMAKIESGKFVLASEPFSMLSAMREVDGIIAQRCREKNIAYVTNLKDLPDIVVKGDKLRLKQVLINLLGNAVKFTDEGGWMRFEIHLDHETETAVRLCFSVEDNGIGMTDEQVSRLFGAFEQADSTVAVKYGGTGLGLAISQNMVRQMGGEIAVKSRIKGGSCFWFDILFQKAELTVETQMEAETLDLSGRTFLLAEDVAVNRLIIAELLSDTGVHLDEAEDGIQALERFRNAGPGYYDLILMDVQMPEMDGYETTRAIRALSRDDAKTVPIIAMTANVYKEDIDKALESGMNGHIAKPVDLGILREMLRKHVR